MGIRKNEEWNEYRRGDGGRGRSGEGVANATEAGLLLRVDTGDVSGGRVDLIKSN